MKSPVPEGIFSPRCTEGNIFSFSPNLQQQRRQRNTETEKVQGMEHRPMLRTGRNSAESDAELDRISGSDKGLLINRRSSRNIHIKEQYRMGGTFSAFFFEACTTETHLQCCVTA
jgi:hypothetical protein